MGHWTPSFYGYDGMGDVRQLTNTSGAVTDTYEYDAFGNKIASTGTTPNNYLYRGEQYDTNLGLYYLRARYYNPLTGRFLARDPAPGNIAIPATLHKYLYTGGEPVNWVDPTGRADLAETGEIDLNVSEGATAGEEATAREVSCILDTAGALIAAVTPSPELQGILVAVQINGQQCDAAAEREEGDTCFFCFPAGTPVHTNHGDVPVEAIKVDDEVLSRNRESGKLEYEPVTALTLPHKDKLVSLTIEGEREPLRPATDHPFWVRRGYADLGSWITAGQMRLGDFVQTTQRNWRRVIAVTPAPQEQTVYNFTVANDHDYFVGQTGFLVHNAPACGCKWGQEGHHIVPENMPGFGPAKGVLDNAGIDINDLANLLPLDYYYHRRIHTNVYRDWANRTLTTAEENGDSITCTLESMGQQILGGKAPF